MFCKYCGEDKTDDQFEIANTIKGKEYKRKKCRQCYQNDKNEYRQRAREWLDNYKKSLSCERCGLSDYRCLDFHHLGQKDFGIGNSLGRRSIENIQQEIEKCIVLCANCHRIEHHEEKNITR